MAPDEAPIWGVRVLVVDDEVAPASCCGRCSKAAVRKFGSEHRGASARCANGIASRSSPTSTAGEDG
jgi:hypothetical protein